MGVGRPGIALALILAAASPLGAQEQILFVGNSFTGEPGDVAELVAAMAEASGVGFNAELVAPGGFSFEAHFEEAGQGRDAITEGGWDRVVLQEQSRRPIFFRPLFERYGRLLVAEVVSVGARPVLYMTWARAHRPEEQEPLTRAYCDLAAELGADLAPVGAAWQRSLAERPDLPLHGGDGSHPNPRGVYLSALVLYSVLTGQRPVGLPHALLGVTWVSPEEAARLQAVAQATLDAHHRSEICGSTLSLLGGRIEVRVGFHDPFGGEGPGRPVPLTDDSGAFWFFEPDNLELLVKVLDVRSVNCHFWVFYGALSNVGYTIEVTDTFTGAQRTYENPQGRMASRGDTRAFPGGG